MWKLTGICADLKKGVPKDRRQYVWNIDYNTSGDNNFRFIKSQLDI